MMRLDQGSRGEELYNELSRIMERYTPGDRLFALGLFGTHTRRWLMHDRNLSQEQADMLISLALTSAEDSWKQIEARNEQRTLDRQQTFKS